MSDTGAHERRLAAIVFTDVAGYSARMQRDETGTMALVRIDFERMRALCAQHGGEVLKSTGDGLLLCFSSVVQAVACGLQIQKEFGARPAEALQHRVGIHLGDVFREGHDVTGDGVNIAARLQTRARPGTVCLSQSVYDAVKGKLPMQVESLGPQQFKNIAEPIIVYLVAAAGAILPPATKNKSPLGWLVAAGLVLAGLLAVLLWPQPAPAVGAPRAAAPVSDKSIAVLPFTNMSDDKDSGYFADGVHEDILTNLAHIASLRVVSRTSVIQYRDTKKPIRQIAAELNVAYVLEGSVRRAANTVRVTGQLIKASTDEHVWAQAYDRELKDVFAIQAALATQIADALQTTISPEQKTRLARVPTRVPAAYDLLLQARALLNGYLVWDADFEEKLRRTESLLRSAVELDPEFAIAWSYLGNVHSQIYYFAVDQTDKRREMAREAVEKAEKLAPDEPAVIRNAGAYDYYSRHDYAGAEERYRRLLGLQPNDSEAYALLGMLLRRQGKWAEALEALRRAYELDPGNRQRQVGLLSALVFFARRYDEGAALAARLARQENDPLGEITVDCAYIPFYARGSTAELAALVQGTPAELRMRPEFRAAQHDLAEFRGDWAELARLDAQAPAGEASRIDVGTTLAALGRMDEARQHLNGEPDRLRNRLQLQPGNLDLYVALARAEVLLGHKEEALDALKQAESHRPAGDRLDETEIRRTHCFVLAWSGDREAALGEIAALMRSPGGFTSHSSRVSAYFAPLHGDPRFEALVNDPANNAPLF